MFTHLRFPCHPVGGLCRWHGGTCNNCAPPEGAMALSGASSKPSPCSQVRTCFREIDNEMMWIPLWSHLDMCGQPMTIKSGQPMTIKRAMYQASDGCHSAGFPPSKVCVSLKTLTASRFQASCLVWSKLSAPHGSHGMQFLMRQTRSCPTAWEGSSQASISSGSGNSNSTPCTSNPSWHKTVIAKPLHKLQFVVSCWCHFLSS